jgi:hypothetical protein
VIALLPARTRHFLHAAICICSDRRYFILDSIQHFFRIANVLETFRQNSRPPLSLASSKHSGRASSDRGCSELPGSYEHSVVSSPKELFYLSNFGDQLHFVAL